ncbi:hypothetical protein SDC9_68898 [bioreactor metagenome]|uniref:Uncharacterized protein n=1 Tax=bioreactor metagenome TaxID=1076179 RepID=A0A644Y788_9ZZZZ
MGGIARDGDGRAAAALQKPCVFKKADVDHFSLAAQDGPRAVGHLGIREDQSGQVFLIARCLCAVQNALVKNLCGLRPHAAQNPEAG